MVVILRSGRGAILHRRFQGRAAVLGWDQPERGVAYGARGTPAGAADAAPASGVHQHLQLGTRTSRAAERRVRLTGRPPPLASGTGTPSGERARSPIRSPACAGGAGGPPPPGART